MIVSRNRRRRAHRRSSVGHAFGSVLAFPILVTLICLVATRPATAQSMYGTIVGVVTDPSEAVVPDAKVEATQTETNEKLTATTNDSGIYTLSTFPHCTYGVSISKSGFDEFEAREF